MNKNQPPKLLDTIVDNSVNRFRTTQKGTEGMAYGSMQAILDTISEHGEAQDILKVIKGQTSIKEGEYLKERELLDSWDFDPEVSGILFLVSAEIQIRHPELAEEERQRFEGSGYVFRERSS